MKDYRLKDSRLKIKRLSWNLPIFQSSNRFSINIPTASTADIAFLLIIFFMLSTVFRMELGLKITVPGAESTERLLKRRNVVNVWLDRSGRISINDNRLDLNGVRSVITGKLADNPDLIAEIRADQDIDYGRVNDVLETLRDAGVLKVTFATHS